MPGHHCYRKPYAGMLRFAIQETQVSHHNCCMAADRHVDDYAVFNAWCRPQGCSHVLEPCSVLYVASPGQFQSCQTTENHFRKLCAGILCYVSEQQTVIRLIAA